MRVVRYLLVAAIAGVTIVAVRAQLACAQDTKPSFDCAKASQPDERAICGDQQLAELDNLSAAGFNFVKLKYGKSKALNVARPLLKLRRACGGNRDCIRQRQIDAIRTYQKLGAPITLPELLSASQFESARALSSHCAQAGNDDRLRPIPEAIILDVRQAFEMSPETSTDYVLSSTVFRCMNGKIWLCSYGANLVCDKADVSRVSKGATAYCKGSPGSSFVPMSATGHATIYEWECQGSKAHIRKQLLRVDPRGFIAENWKQLTTNP